MIVDFILIAGMSLLFLLVVFLLKSNSGFSKKLLSVFFINSVFFLLYYYAYLHRSRYLGGVAFTFGNGTGFLLGPILLFYIRSLILPTKRIVKPLLLHLIPFFLFWLFISLPIGLTMIFGLFTEYHQQYLVVGDYINLLENAYFLIYIWFSFRLIKRIQFARGQIYSYVESENLRWISYLILGLIAIVLLDSLFSVYEIFYPPITWNIGTVIAFALILLYIFLGYMGMFQAQILLPHFLLELNEETPSEEITEKPSAQVRQIKQLDTFSQGEITELKMKLNKILSEQKLYLNDSLSLSDLAEELELTDKKLSELLNQHLNTNFYNLINEYRVSEVKQKLKEADHEKYTLLGLAYDCGFQSKTSFNRVFKQKTGMSPSKYKEYISE